jgi:hypothetical protein
MAAIDTNHCRSSPDSSYPQQAPIPGLQSYPTHTLSVSEKELIMWKHIALVAVISIFWVSQAMAGDNEMNSFLGLWRVDFERTMEAAKKSPKYSAKDAERLPAMVKKMMGMMKIKLADGNMSYVRGAKEISIPYRVKTASRNSATVACSHGDKTFDVRFTLIDGNYMNFKSSASDDMHYYIWKRSEG